MNVTGASDACSCAKVAPLAKPLWKALPVATAIATPEPAPPESTVPVRTAGVNTLGELVKNEAKVI